jgi:hypothetical protein
LEVEVLEEDFPSVRQEVALVEEVVVVVMELVVVGA